MDNFNNEPETRIPRSDLIEAANTMARLGVYYEVLSDYMQTRRFQKALERFHVMIPKEILESPFFQVVETPYFDKKRGEKQTVTFSVDPNLSSESKSLDFYWLDVSKKPSFKLFQKELIKIHQTTLDDTPIEVIHLNKLLEDIQTTMVSMNFQRDLHVSQNLKETEAEAFQVYYEQNAKHYRKQADLKESEREAQHNRQQALESARQIQRQLNHCQSEKEVTYFNLDVCQLDLANQSKEAKLVLTEAQSKQQTIAEQLEKQTIEKQTVEKQTVEKQLNQALKLVEDIKKSDLLTLEQKDAQIAEQGKIIQEKCTMLSFLTNSKQELELENLAVWETLSNLNQTVVDVRHRMYQCLEEKEIQVANENNKCRINDQVISNEEEFQKLRYSWDQEILRERLATREFHLATREFNHQQHLLKFQQEYEKIQQGMNQEIETVAASCRQDATTVLNENQKLSKHLQECANKLDECQRNCPKPKLAGGISELTRFQKGFHQIFGWSVSFLIWPLALHDPDSPLWLILGQTSGIQIKRGFTGILRGWTCEILAAGLTVLWWLFLWTLINQLVWENRNEKTIKASKMVKNSGKITKWEKLKERVGGKVSRFFSEDPKLPDSIVSSRLRGGSSERRHRLEYSDFLLFVTIHAYKTCNFHVVAPTKSFQVKKDRSRWQSMSDTLSRPLGIIAFVFLISSSQLPNLPQQGFLEVTSPIRISNQFENQAESRVMRLAQAELEGESRMETQIENPKMKVGRKKFQKRKRMVKEKMKLHFSDRILKKQKQVKKLSDLPPLKNCETDVLVENNIQRRIPEPIRITSHLEIT